MLNFGISYLVTFWWGGENRTLCGLQSRLPSFGVAFFVLWLFSLGKEELLYTYTSKAPRTKSIESGSLYVFKLRPTLPPTTFYILSRTFGLTVTTRRYVNFLGIAEVFKFFSCASLTGPGILPVSNLPRHFPSGSDQEPPRD